MTNLCVFAFMCFIYFFIGHMLYKFIIIELCNDRYGNTIYQSMDASAKFIFCAIIVLLWLPILIGELISAIFIWIAKYH